MLSPGGVCTAIALGLVVVCAYGAGPESAPPDPIDLVEESVVAGTGIGPDVIVGNLHEVASYGTLPGGNISAFAVGTISCNIGDVWLRWCTSDPTPHPDCSSFNQHPVIGQSMYRLKNDRFEHIGQSWLKHGFFALSQGLCFSDCQATDGTHLGVHCSDPYSAQLNGQQSNLGPKYQVNAHIGVFPYPPANPPYTGNIARRLQVRNSDIDPSLNGGGLYFVEGHYVTQDDAAAGNQNNNASYRRVTVSGSGTNWTLTLAATTQREQPAIRAWKDNDPAVVETDAQVPGEGLFILAAKATDRGDGYFHYEYAMQNLNSDRSGGSFTVPLPPGVVIPPESIGFHDVDYHSGDGPGGQNWDGTDWEATVEVGKITWATTPYNIDPNANALRWSTLYNFRFDANVVPVNTTVTLGLFKPGSPSEVTIGTIGPALALIDCNLNGIPDACDVDCGGVGCTAYEECGGSSDCAINANGDGNGVPDECEDDCQPNGFPDACDIFDGRSEDCQLPNGNTVPDECEADCDGDGIPDTCETITDTDGDGIDDCDDLCPETTPINACVPPATVNCCFCASPLPVCASGYPRDDCLSTNGTPICSEPPTCFGTVCPESQCRDGCLVGDFDRDGDLDLFDVAALQDCYSGSIGSPDYVVPSAECLLRFDFDDDGDIDLVDVDEFLTAYTGP